MTGHIRSLNLANATTVAAYQAMAQINPAVLDCSVSIWYICYAGGEWDALRNIIFDGLWVY